MSHIRKIIYAAFALVVMSSTFQNCSDDFDAAEYEKDSSSVAPMGVRTQLVAIENGTCDKALGTNGQLDSACFNIQCNSGYYPKDGKCAKILAQTVPCSIANGQGVSILDANGQYGSCMLQSCQPNYTSFSNSCHPISVGCDVTNGTGTKNFNSVSGQYDACVMNSCNSNSFLAGSECKLKANCSWRYDNSNTINSVAHGVTSKGNPAYGPTLLYVPSTSSRNNNWSVANWNAIKVHTCLGGEWK